MNELDGIVNVLTEHTRQIDAIAKVTKDLIDKVTKLEISKAIDDTLKAQANE